MNWLMRYKWVLAFLLVDVALYIYDQTLGREIMRRTQESFVEMLSFIPPIFVLLGLLDVWVPREKVVAHLGLDSGMAGMGLATFLGAAAAGPLYGAFPVAAVMMKKGASFYNVMIFIGAWATLKLPMFLFETQYLGPVFAGTRWIVSLIGIVVIAVTMDALLSSAEKQEIYRKHSEVPPNQQPGCEQGKALAPK
ncbi:permease [Sporomusa acidovorans]|uniref:Permease n=1 Tax=Sporomusa acidovorans (strain ATCC 49682 / DSM 3132 / Mol) TaxID=1123286 RepID=A0ABZ3IY13_SPOA4|nr:permease [Sporomusa acidovorans]OZC17700.1 putative permease [Sporomusa acidovorans DSM 3132]SDE12386.1 Predicted permease [Sporomusa acidovorans]